LPFASLAFLAGVLLVQQQAQLPSLWWALTAVPPLVLAWWRPWALIGVCFVLGVVWAGFRAGLILDDALATELEGRDLVLVGHVADIPQVTQFGMRFLFDVEQAQLDDVDVRVPRRVLLNSAVDDFVARAGERWRLRVRLARPHGFQNPGGFDYEGHLFRNRIRARGYVRAETAPLRLAGGAARYAVDAVRQRLGERIAGHVDEHATAGFVVALANGDGRRVDQSQWDVLRATGTIHLVVISGLHISLIGGIVFFVARFLWALPGVTVQWCPAPVVGAVAALVLATVYAALAGFVVPTQRALIMLTVAMSGILLRRRFPPLQLLSVALLLVLLYDPLSVMAAGFWLSFAAVAIIVFIVSDDDRAWWRRLGYLQLAVALGMLPLLLALFGQVSLVAPLANLIAIPVFDTVAVPLTLLGIAVLPLSDAAAGALFDLAATALAWLWPLLEWLGRLPYAQWAQHSPPAWALVAAVAGVTLLLAPRGWPARWVGGVWLLPLFLVRPPTPNAGEVWFTLLDVGQGLAAVVRTREHVLVYDTGPRFSETFDTGEAVVLPYLRARGIGQVDLLVISHGDNDHRGGAESMLQALAQTPVLSSAPALPFASAPCVRGMRWEWDSVRFEILHPPTDARDRHNNHSCVLRVVSAFGSVLLPGDIETRAELSLLAGAREQLAADVLVAPHHGSKSSSHEAFVAAVHPKHVLFPVGYRNRYRHPHPAVLERYRGAGAQLHDSPAHGALEFRIGAAGIDLDAYRSTQRRYWFDRN
jgi:competence protein ComEC